jgi:1-deoxy-D-xylulose-5-phosphate reductoisomerase
MNKMKKIAILGSTGSIGKNAIEVVRQHPDKFKAVLLTANTQVDRLIEQARLLSPDAVCIVDTRKSQQLKDALADTDITCVTGEEALYDLIRHLDYDLVLNAIVGAAGMMSTIETVKRGKDVALSNKESLVMAGQLINKLASDSGANIYPVDSEHSAIWQCLQGEKSDNVESLILTGSGGPFLRRDLTTFDTITPAEALKHPNWSMGSKITIDSATMFNKGLELIEACHLFHLDESKIDILIHPESIVHSMVQFKDGSVKAQLGVPDMKVPIQYALSYPDHLKTNWPRLDLAAIGTLHFEEPDVQKFPSLKLAREALQAGGTYPAVLNMANEKAVKRFLDGEIGFKQIFKDVEKALDEHRSLDPFSVEDLVSLARM